MAKTEPVVLTKDQAEAIEDYEYNGGKRMALRVKLSPTNRFMGEFACLNDLTDDELARALYVGYTVEKTQKEREADVKAYYYQMRDEWELGRASGIIAALNLLGITIEGVND
ncbi:hypothetical protein MM326_13945 [Alkalihalobacillus sp. LMS6]|uniref:hypothetical protein n=1 Tax=Alkalihalobacillus sp. LMS6 TaxID=2924034 RepID=UPI0020CFEF0A|nr:hypothetical protein [Alkalihalobacillus sp. LMS6]UTR05205.1 hypothetical protein MM326_13945 [Alkalihalobacillus sp. LMS6]